MTSSVPEAIATALQKPGEGLIVDDPRGAIIALGRKLGSISTSPVAQRPDARPRQDMHRTEAELIAVLQDAPDWNRVAQTDEDRRAAGRRIVARAQAADELGRLKSPSPEALAALDRCVKERSLHKDWLYHGVDGASALRSLIQLHAPSAVKTARFVLWRDDPALAEVADPRYNNPRSWTDFRVKMVAFPALERLPGQPTEQLCRDNLALDDEAALEHVGQMLPMHRELIGVVGIEVTGAMDEHAVEKHQLGIALVEVPAWHGCAVGGAERGTVHLPAGKSREGLEIELGVLQSRACELVGYRLSSVFGQAPRNCKQIHPALLCDRSCPAVMRVINCSDASACLPWQPRRRAVLRCRPWDPWHPVGVQLPGCRGRPGASERRIILPGGVGNEGCPPGRGDLASGDRAPHNVTGRGSIPGRRSPVAPATRADGERRTERTQETFGAAAPGRRVLYSASWVLVRLRRSGDAAPL